MCSDVFLQHAGFLTADAAFLADVFPSTAAANVNVVLVGFVPEGMRTSDTDWMMNQSEQFHMFQLNLVKKLI